MSLVNSSAQLLRSRITHGEWPLGSKIPIEAELAKRLKVSRSTVREAVRILAVQGLLDVRQGAGTFVRATAVANDVERRLERATLRDQFEARLGLEVEAVRLGSLRHSPRTIATLHALLDARGESNDARDKPGFVAHDHAFHVAVVAASKNEALINLYEFFSQSVSKTIAATLTGDIPEPDMAAHRSIIDAMASGDPERADATLRAFMSPILSTLNHMLAD
jgi:DNA-binding FadR family transcriptional regulator